MPSINDPRRKLFAQLAGGEDGELSARYLKGDFESPKTPVRLIDDRVLILVTDTQLRAAEERFRNADGTRPNLTSAFQGWFVDAPAVAVRCTGEMECVEVVPVPLGVGAGLAERCYRDHDQVGVFGCNA